MSYKYLLPIIALCFSVLSAQAQCSIENSKEADGIIVYQAKFESLYKNVGNNNDGDYSLGFIQVHGRLFTHSEPKSSGKKWGLQIGVVGKPTSQVIIPRKVLFSFLDGTNLSLSAASYEDKGPIELCQFNLTESERILLRKPIRTIVITDNRTGQSYTSDKRYGLYDRVLSEQVGCLE